MCLKLLEVILAYVSFGSVASLYMYWEWALFLYILVKLAVLLL